MYSLLSVYNPDILVVTGHDGMIKRNVDYYDIYNYRNSKHFIETVKEARRYDSENKKILLSLQVPVKVILKQLFLQELILLLHLLEF